MKQYAKLAYGRPHNIGTLADRRHGFTIVFKRQFGYSEKVLARRPSKGRVKIFAKFCVQLYSGHWNCLMLNAK